MCGRFGLDLTLAWSLTPGEFEDWLSGAVDGERDRRYWQAAIVSAVFKTMGGHSVSPEVLLGEADPDEGALADDPLTIYRRFREDAQRNAEKQRRREVASYLPSGIELDDVD